MGARTDLNELGVRILNQSRTELYMSMHFMARSLHSLGFVMDLNTQRIGTEGESIHFNPEFLFHLFIESPQKLHRLYLHLLLHCLFRHMTKGDDKEKRLWNLACDIHVEAVLDSMDYDIIRRPQGEFRERALERLKQECKVLTAERIYQYFLRETPNIDEFLLLSREFEKDDHQFWALLEDEDNARNKKAPFDEDLNPSEEEKNENSFGDSQEKDGDTKNTSQKGDSSQEQKEDRQTTDSKDTDRKDTDHKDHGNPADHDANSTEAARKRKEEGNQRRQELSDKWKDTAEKLKSELSTLSGEASDEVGSLFWQLELQYKQYTDFRDFLRLLMLEREEIRIDPDSFDYGFYYYGLEMYGNMPLIEENEFSETKKVEKLIIAIDTSASCKDGLVQKFLNQTAGMLSDKEGFFRKVEVHIIECDDRIQNDITIFDVEEMENYSSGFSVKGGYGTDFRPVFEYLEDAQRKGKISDIKGLMYFTDGYGEYPKVPSKYPTAFVFPKGEDYTDQNVPNWAWKLYIDEI